MTTRATYEMDFDTGYGELCNVPCAFDVQEEVLDGPDYTGRALARVVCEYGAQLDRVYMDRLELTRAQMVLMIGEKAVLEMETTAGEYYLNRVPQAQASGHPVMGVA